MNTHYCDAPIIGARLLHKVFVFIREQLAILVRLSANVERQNSGGNHLIKRYFTLLTSLLAPALVLGAAQQIELRIKPPLAKSAGVINETPNRWFVEFASKPAVEGPTQKALNQERNAFRAAAKKAGLKYQERFAFGKLFNGLSVTINPKDLGKLSRVPGVKALYPVLSVAMMANNPDLYTAMTMTGAGIVQNELGYTGEGIRVAVVDKGARQRQQP